MAFAQAPPGDSRADGTSPPLPKPQERSRARRDRAAQGDAWPAGHRGGHPL